MKRVIFTAVAILICCALSLQAEEPWKLAKEGEGIKVYTRSVPGSASNEFKGIAEINAPIDVIMEVFKDIPSYPEWYGFCKEIRLLKEVNEDHRVIYFVLKTMGPVQDRDMVIDAVSKFDKKAGKATIETNALKEPIVPLQEKYVRMTDVKGVFSMSATSPDKTNVVYIAKADPAGYIPTFVSNILQKDQPFLTLKGLREMIKKDVYYKKAGIARKN